MTLDELKKELKTKIFILKSNPSIKKNTVNPTKSRIQFIYIDTTMIQTRLTSLVLTT